MNPPSVALLLQTASEMGIEVDYVETNGAWYRNFQSARAILGNLKAAGLSTLLISISPFHNEHIPFQKVQGVIEACQATGISIFPWVAEFIPDLSALDPSRPHSLEEYERHFGDGYIAHLPHRYWITPGGRALETFAAFRPPRPLAEILEGETGGCRELADASHFHIDLYGNYIPGLCSGLAIHRDDLGRPLREEEYPILIRLFSKGIGSFVHYAAERYGFQPSRSSYGWKCELCFEARRYLVIHQKVESKELQPPGHYLYP